MFFTHLSYYVTKRTSQFPKSSLPLHPKSEITDKNMDILSLNPRHGKDTLRLGDSDELVVMENFGALPKGSLTMDKHALIVICTQHNVVNIAVSVYCIKHSTFVHSVHGDI